MCYRKGGLLAVTDANLQLGRLLPQYFPHIFGPMEDQPLDAAATQAAFAHLTAEINEFCVANCQPPVRSATGRPDRCASANGRANGWAFVFRL